jgi:cytochrome c-type biogenesis protein CcmH
MKAIFRLTLFLLLFCGTLILVQSVFAQSEQPVSDDEVNQVAQGLYCPVCENIPLDVCPTQACAQWRELIRDKLSQGWSKKQIEDYFVEQYGDRVLAVPPKTGLNWLIYALTLGVIFGGIIVTIYVIQGKKQSYTLIKSEKPETSHVISQDIMDKINRDLDEEDEES